MNRRKPTRALIRLDMTPMVDVAFLLLTFFMLTATFRPPEDLPVDVPESRTLMKIPSSDKLMLTVDSEQRLWMFIEDSRLRKAVFPRLSVLNHPIARGDLAPLISRIQIENMAIYGAQASLQVVLKADRRMPYAFIHDIIETLRAGQITAVYLMTHPK